MPLGGKEYHGSVAVHNPAGVFVRILKEALAKRGIAVTGQTRTIDWKYREVTPFDPAKLIELGYVESPPLSAIVQQTLKPSQNLYAQLLLLQVGANAGRNAALPGPSDPSVGDPVISMSTLRNHLEQLTLGQFGEMRARGLTGNTGSLCQF